MMNKRCLGFLAACVLILAPTAQAVTGEGIQLGPTLLFPVLDVTATYDSNVYQASENPESGWETSVAPSLRLVLPVRRFYINAEGGLDFLNYDVESVTTTDWFVGAAVGADFPGGLSFKIADRQELNYQTTDQEFGPGEDLDENTLTAMVSYAIRNALRLELSGVRRAYDFEISDDRDRVESLGSLTLYWKFRPAISALFEGSYEAFQYDSYTVQDNSETQVALGLTWDVTERSTGHVKAGYQWKRYDVQDLSLGTEDGDYFTLAAGVRHFFTVRTVLAVDLSHESQESDFPENPYFLRTTVGASLSQRFTPKLYGRVGARYSSDAYPNATSYDNPYDTSTGLESGKRTDNTIDATVALGFDVTRWFALELAYNGEWRDSNFDTFDYDQNRVSLSAKAAF